MKISNIHFLYFSLGNSESLKSKQSFVSEIQTFSNQNQLSTTFLIFMKFNLENVLLRRLCTLHYRWEKIDKEKKDESVPDFEGLDIKRAKQPLGESSYFYFQLIFILLYKHWNNLQKLELHPDHPLSFNPSRCECINTAKNAIYLWLIGTAPFCIIFLKIKLSLLH